MENIIENLEKIDEDNVDWSSWSLNDKKKLLELYYIISKKESHIFDLIYQYHGCDSWEDIFRDYDPSRFEDKASGVKIAIDRIEEIEEEIAQTPGTAELQEHITEKKT